MAARLGTIGTGAGVSFLAATAALIQPHAGCALGTGRIAARAGIGVITPLGFAVLTASTPQSRLGQTMGTAELGSELGDASGPLLVGSGGGQETRGRG